MSDSQKTYTRFVLAERIEHALLVLSFGMLALTGIPQKFPEWGLSNVIISLFGGIEGIRFVHRIAAFVAMLETIYHVVYTGYKMFVNRARARIVPEVKDGLDAFQAIKYNLGFSKEKPRMKRFNFAEKAEYWAMIWGYLVMGLTGFMLWNPILTTKFLPGQFVPAAKAAHGGEAVLAVLAIIVWHFYNVHLKEFNWSMITGKMTRHQMEEEHALELEEIETGSEPDPVTAEVKKKRQKIFIPIASVFVLLGLAFSIFFIAYEDSAIDTIPPVEVGVVAYSPQTATPMPTIAPQPTSEPLAEGVSLAWSNGIGDLFNASCASCHGAMGGLDVSSYSALMAGGKSGSAIVPGDPASGSVVEIQDAGGHAGQFSADQLAMVKTWIEDGAPEKAAGAAAGGLNWAGAVSSILSEKCLSCHGGRPSVTAGGVNLSSYEAAMQDGTNGAVIVPGDPDASLLVTFMKSGNHPEQFSKDELNTIIEWISAGAPAE